MSKFLDLTGLAALVENIDNELATKVDKESGKSLSTNDFTNEYKTKLEGIGEGANKTTVDNSLSPSSTNPVQNKIIKAELDKKLNISQKGSAGGVAELGADGKVPAAQLPSYVDDVIEGYFSGGKFYKESAHTTEIKSESDKIYVDISSKKIYRWSGSAYAEISSSLALGTTSSTAGRGDWTKTAYDHATGPHAPTTAATQSAMGLMSAADKTKLDNITAITTAEVDALFE